MYVCTCVRLWSCGFSTWAAEWKSHPCTSLPQRCTQSVREHDIHHNVSTHSLRAMGEREAVGNPWNRPEQRKTNKEEQRKNDIQGDVNKCDPWHMHNILNICHTDRSWAWCHSLRGLICACAYLQSSGAGLWGGRASGISQRANHSTDKLQRCSLAQILYNPVCLSLLMGAWKTFDLCVTASLALSVISAVVI